MTEEERLEMQFDYHFYYHDGVLDNVKIFEVCGIYDRDGNYYEPETCREEIRVNITHVLGLLNWLNAHHFDYRGLIEKGLALEVTKGMYKTE